MRAGRAEVIPISLALDLLLGEPPTGRHPVMGMGRLIGCAEQCAPREDARRQLVYGACIAAAGAGLAWAAGALLVQVIDRVPAPVGRLLEAAVLKTTFSVRSLAEAGMEVERALDRGDLPGARRLASWHLVSRDTSALGEAQVAAAAVESVAENTSDSIVAPLFFYTAGGLPAALAYRFLNTADAMLGYRDARREWLGKVPARTDDVLNWLPARLTAVLVVLSAFFTGDNAVRAWRIWRRDARLTASPNAGHPMSAAAGALGVTLEKVGNYELGAGQRLPRPADVGRSVRLMYAVTAAAAGLFALVLVLRGARGRS